MRDVASQLRKKGRENGPASLRLATSDVDDLVVRVRGKHWTIAVAGETFHLLFRDIVRELANPRRLLQALASSAAEDVADLTPHRPPASPAPEHAAGMVLVKYARREIALAGTVARLRREGDYWTIAFADVTTRLRDSKGLGYLAQLLRHPGREFHAFDLVRLQIGDDSVKVRADRGVPVLDPQAKTAYRRRLAELRAELAEAEQFNDAGRAERAREEMEAIYKQLAAAVGLGGRDRESASAAERARMAVTQRVRAAIKRIAAQQPSLADHLAGRIETGTFCVYRPDPTRPIEWDLD
jgi:hypothetical protein